MELKIVGIGNSNGIIIPRAVLQLFDISHNDTYKASFSKNRIVLDKIKIEKSNPQPLKKPKEGEPILDKPIIKRKRVRVPVEDEPIEVDAGEPIMDESTEVEYKPIDKWVECPYCGSVYINESLLNFHLISCSKRRK